MGLEDEQIRVQTDLLPVPEDTIQVIRCGCTRDYRKNGLWLVLIVKVWHAKMQVPEVSQIMKEIVNNVHRMGQILAT